MQKQNIQKYFNTSHQDLASQFSLCPIKSLDTLLLRIQHKNKITPYLDLRLRGVVQAREHFAKNGKSLQ